jgi:flagellum-specific peptidoglycan hydrolase FlgJ
MNEIQSRFLQAAVPAAIASQGATGVPASITIAQAILESGWGCSALARKANNYFGIKAVQAANPERYIELPTHEVVNGHSIEEEARFARYPSQAAGFTAHAKLLSGASRYIPAMAVRRSAAEFANAIQRCGYSTNPNYAKSLMQLVREFDLTQYDVPTASAEG